MNMIKDLVIDATEKALNEMIIDIEYIIDFERIDSSIIDNIDDFDKFVLCDHDNDKRIWEYINNAIIKVFGYTSEDIFTIVYNTLINDFSIEVIDHYNNEWCD